MEGKVYSDDVGEKKKEVVLDDNANHAIMVTDITIKSSPEKGDEHLFEGDRLLWSKYDSQTLDEKTRIANRYFENSKMYLKYRDPNSPGTDEYVALTRLMPQGKSQINSMYTCRKLESSLQGNAIEGNSCYLKAISINLSNL